MSKNFGDPGENVFPPVQIPNKAAMVFIKRREDSRNFNGNVNTYGYEGAEVDDFWREMLIFFISLEHQAKFDYDMINGLSIISKPDNTYDFKIWTLNNSQITDVVLCLENVMQQVLGKQFLIKPKTQFGTL